MLFAQLLEQLQSLENLLMLLNDAQYNREISFLSGSSIGMHSRHIIEILKCTVKGYNTGVVNYLNRNRNLLLETNKAAALKELSRVVSQLIKPDKQIDLVVSEEDSGIPICIGTTYFREIVHNVEHTIHHLALIRVALKELGADLTPENFGVAYATKRYAASQKK